MKLSNYPIRTRKETPKDTDSKNASFLIRGGYIDKLMAGVYSYLPIGLKVIKNIENIIRQELDNIGCQEVLMPVLSPKENWQKTDRWDNLDVLFKMVGADDQEIALNPTHEEIIVPIVKGMNISYKELPLALYQIQAKFRNELRVKSGLLRGREFLMKDLYTFHATEEELDKFYEISITSYKKIFDRLGIGDKTVVTCASGGTFSKYSHEFQTISESGEDTIYLCEKCQEAVNKEIISENNKCPKCQSNDLKEKKSIEVGNIFKLKDKYSEPFGLKITTKDGNEVNAIMGCYGIGVSRVMGAIVEVLAEENKIVWPEEIAPFKYTIISLGKNEKAEAVYNELNKSASVILDDREDISAGQKFADADLIGSPHRIIVSEKSLASGGYELIDVKTKNSEIKKI